MSSDSSFIRKQESVWRNSGVSYRCGFIGAYDRLEEAALKAIIEKDGKDLAVTLPQEVLDDAGIKIGDEIDVSVKGGRIVIVRKEPPVHPAV